MYRKNHCACIHRRSVLAGMLFIVSLLFAGCDLPQDANPGLGNETGFMWTKAAEYQFTDRDVKASPVYSRGVNLTAGKRAWICVGMDDGIDWPASTPTGRNVDFFVLPQCRLSLKSGQATLTETTTVTGGYAPSGPDRDDFHSFTHKVPRAMGQMSRQFETSYMLVEFTPIQTGLHTIEFTHALQPRQNGFRKYKVVVYQSK